MMRVLGPVKMRPSTLGGADKVLFELYDVNELGSLNGSLYGSNDDIP